MKKEEGQQDWTEGEVRLQSRPHKAPVNPERSAVASISHQACINQPYYFLYLLIFWYLKNLAGEEEIAPARAS